MQQQQQQEPPFDHYKWHMEQVAKKEAEYALKTDEELIEMSNDNQLGCARGEAWEERIKRGHVDPETGMPAMPPDDGSVVTCCM